MPAMQIGTDVYIIIAVVVVTIAAKISLFAFIFMRKAAARPPAEGPPGGREE